MFATVESIVVNKRSQIGYDHSRDGNDQGHRCPRRADHAGRRPLHSRPAARARPALRPASSALPERRADSPGSLRHRRHPPAAPAPGENRPGAGEHGRPPEVLPGQCRRPGVRGAPRPGSQDGGLGRAAAGGAGASWRPHPGGFRLWVGGQRPGPCRQRHRSDGDCRRPGLSDTLRDPPGRGATARPPDQSQPADAAPP